jgi:hypothetical protein
MVINVAAVVNPHGMAAFKLTDYRKTIPGSGKLKLTLYLATTS